MKRVNINIGGGGVLLRHKYPVRNQAGGGRT